MELFYELVQIALGQRETLSHKPSDNEWGELFTWSQKQAVSGVVLIALDKLTRQRQKPPMNLLLEWIGLSEQIKVQNQLLNKRCGEITKQFADAGFRTCILKGQGNALMYSDPLSRNSGDIDLWVDGSRKEICDFVFSKCPDAEDGDMHIEAPFFKDVVVEVHYFPRYSNVPKYDKRLQVWFKEKSEAQFTNRVKLSPGSAEYVCVPTVQFNAVQQMSHIMGHFFVEGIGLRQFIDYFYVLKKLNEENCSDNFEELFEYLGMLKFARGVMWVEKEVLGLDDKYLLTSPDERLGKVILKEIEEGGNFGHHDKRYTARNKGILMRGIVDSCRLLKLAYYFPEDALWKILRKVENQKWRLKNARN